jgi:hypothetical protein
MKNNNDISILIKKLDEYLCELDNIDSIHRRNAFLKVMKDLRQYIRKYKNEDVIQDFLHSQYFEENKMHFRKYTNYYIRSIEASEILHILICSNIKYASFLDVLESRFSKFHFEKSKDIYNMFLEPQKIKTFLMIESGSIPSTIMYFYEKTNIPNLISIDSNQEAIYMMNEFLEGLNIKDRIQSDRVYPHLYDYKDVDAIYINGISLNKKNILNRIAETAPDHVQIIVRNPIGLKNLIYANARSGLNKRLIIHQNLADRDLSSELLHLRKGLPYPIK